MQVGAGRAKFGYFFVQSVVKSCVLYNKTSLNICPQYTTVATRSTCSNVGGYYVQSVNSSSVPDTTTSTTGRCYYNSYDCSGYLVNGQCFSGRSSEISCPSCTNIGGNFATNDACYYYTNDCLYFSAGKQCHTNRSFSL